MSSSSKNSRKLNKNTFFLANAQFWEDVYYKKVQDITLKVPKKTNKSKYKLKWHAFKQLNQYNVSVSEIQAF